MSVYYVLRLSYRDGRNVTDPPVPIDWAAEDRAPLYLYRSVKRDRRHGWIVTRVSELARARYWATREGAERYRDTHAPVLDHYTVEKVNAEKIDR